MQTNKKLRVAVARAHPRSAPERSAAVPDRSKPRIFEHVGEYPCACTPYVAAPEAGALRYPSERGPWRPRLAVLMIACALVLASGCTPAGPGALLDGQRLIEQGKYVPAIEKLRLATTLLPTNALAWNYLGLAYHHAGESANAMGAYQRAIKLNHELVVVHYDMGCLYLEQNKLNLNESARDELMAFTLHQGNSLDGRLKLGTAQLRLGELAQAEASFREALRISPQNVEAMNGIGMVQVKRNHARDAIAWFEAALKQQPEYPPALLNLAIALQSSANNRVLAVQKYHEYLALNPRPANWEAVSAAERDLNLELNPPATPPVRAATNLVAGPPAASARATTNTPVRAVYTSNSSSRLEVSHPVPGPTQVVGKVNGPAAPVSSNSGAAVKQSSVPVRVEPTEVVQLSNPPSAKLAEDDTPPTATVRESSTVPARATPGTASSGLRPGGLSSTNRYKYRFPAKPSSGDRVAAERLFAQALEAQRDRRLTDAIAGYRAAIQADPGFFEAHWKLGLCAYDANDMPLSLFAYESALAIKPDSFYARFNFALALKKAGYLIDSAQELERSLAVNSAESPAHLAEVHLMLANLYAEQFNQPQAARPHYLKVLDLDPNNTQATTIRYWLRENP
jgi:tetratricopeptide (TPR) repeat protein